MSSASHGFPTVTTVAHRLYSDSGICRSAPVQCSAHPFPKWMEQRGTAVGENKRGVGALGRLALRFSHIRIGQLGCWENDPGLILMGVNLGSQPQELSRLDSQLFLTSKLGT